jgi:hypothetical protein
MDADELAERLATMVGVRFATPLAAIPGRRSCLVPERGH